VGRKARVDITLDCSDPEKLLPFWREALNYRVYYSGPDPRRPEASKVSWAILVPEDGTAPPLVLQRVPEPKSGKNRMHVDIVVDDVELEVRRLEGLGARRLHDGVQSVGRMCWVTMADPEDNEFCVCTGVKW
jgi:hypothetical protein